jgi:hypothetical protein
MITTPPSSGSAQPHDRDDDHTNQAAPWWSPLNWLADVWASYVGRKDPEPPDATPDVPS